MISVIIRSRNEEEYIQRCLEAVSRQEYVDFEIILVDTESNDKTLEIAKNFDCKIINIKKDEFTYGKAINLGIENSKGSHIAILSAHCIPKNTLWLFNMQRNFSNEEIAGVYGKQEPLQSTHPLDKRDLWNTFGLEKKEQKVDPFFHNANSMIRKDLWEKFKFDEKINGVEDRHWAKEVQANGFSIVYDPLPSVYHHHGINQIADEKRADRVVGVIEKYNLK